MHCSAAFMPKIKWANLRRRNRCSLQFAVCSLQFAVCSPQSAVRSPPSSVHRQPSTIYRPLSAIHHLPPTVCRPPSAVSRPLQRSPMDHPPSTVSRRPSTVSRPPSTVHRRPSAGHRPYAQKNLKKVGQKFDLITFCFNFVVIKLFCLKQALIFNLIFKLQYHGARCIQQSLRMGSRRQ